MHSCTPLSNKTSKKVANNPMCGDLSPNHQTHILNSVIPLQARIYTMGPFSPICYIFLQTVIFLSFFFPPQKPSLPSATTFYTFQFSPPPLSCLQLWSSCNIFFPISQMLFGCQWSMQQSYTRKTTCVFPEKFIVMKRINIGWSFGFGAMRQALRRKREIYIL